MIVMYFEIFTIINESKAMLIHLIYFIELCDNYSISGI